MSIKVENTAHTYPGILFWLLVAGIFLVTGERVDTFEKALHHPVLLVLLGVATLFSSVLFARHSDLRWYTAYPLALFVTLSTTGLLAVIILAVARVHTPEFTVWGRTFGLGMALIAGSPLLFLLYAVVSPLVILPFAIADNRRARRKTDEQSSLAKAIEKLRETARRKPEDPSIHLEFARALMRKRKLDESIMPDARHGFMDPDYRQSLKDTLDAAVAAFRDAARLAPNNPDASFELGDALRTQGGLDDAIMELRKAIQLKPDNRLARVSLAFALEQKDNWEGAVAQYREAIRIEPAMPKVHLYLGKALERLGDRPAALEALSKAHELDPVSQEIRYEYERLKRIVGTP